MRVIAAVWRPGFVGGSWFSAGLLNAIFTISTVKNLAAPHVLLGLAVDGCMVVVGLLVAEHEHIRRR